MLQLQNTGTSKKYLVVEQDSGLLLENLVFVILVNNRTSLSGKTLNWNKSWFAILKHPKSSYLLYHLF